MGQLPVGAISLIETVADAETLAVKNPEKLAYVTRRRFRWMTRAISSLPAAALSGIGAVARRHLLANTNRRRR